MGLVGYDLSKYPLGEHYGVCRQYMNRLDWDKISDDIRENGTVGIDISDVISFFSHLELDSEYRLICYMTSEYHGIFGQVAAIKKSDDWQPKCEIGPDFKPRGSGNQHALPECAFPPLEAIYNDGTGEGYFEAVLFSQFLRKLPRAIQLHDHWTYISNVLPDDYEDAWEYQVALADYSPRYTQHTITALNRVYENGMSGSDGKDRIYLSQFNFSTSVNDHLLMTVLRTKRPIDTKHITEGNRYSETRRCCVFTESSILVAKQKHGVF